MNLKFLLTLTAAILGSVKATDEPLGGAAPSELNTTPTTLAEFQALLKMKDILSFEAIDKKNPHHREHTINALEHPLTYMRLNKDDFSKEEAGKDEQYKMYELDITVEEKELLSSEAFKDLDEKLRENITAQYNEKVELLRNILQRIPVIATLPAPENGNDFQKMLRSHIEEFISNTLVYDAKRSSFSALHKSLQGLASIHEVERKAQAVATAILDKIEKAEKAGNIDYKAIGFRVKTEKPVESGTWYEFFFGSDKKEQPKEEKINLINVALKAASKSTSSATNLAFVLIFSLIICSILLAYKTFTADSDKKPEEAEEAEEEH